MKKMKLISVIFLILVLTGSAGYAQDPGQIILQTRIQREMEVINEKGEREIRLVEAANAIPGDELLLTVTYINRGSENAQNVVLVNPVPEHTEYIDDSSGGEGTVVSFSVDGGVTYDLPVNLQVTGDDGRPRTAQAREYTHIRWTRPGTLSPTESGTVFFRVRLK